MKVHEFQAKALLSKLGVHVPQGEVVTSAGAAVTAAKKLGGWPVVLKAQIHAGGRGKGGGVKLARSEDEVRTLATAMIGMNLITAQTGPKGRRVKFLLVEQGMNIAREVYLALTLDRAASKLVFIASAQGGMEIEELAAREPEKIHKVWVDPSVGLADYQVRALAQSLDLKGDVAKGFWGLARALWRAYAQLDLTLAEINPLVVTGDGQVVALDAKVTIDDNALGRHKDIVALRDTDEEEPLEVRASEAGLNYIKLDGNVGCMVNGAGLAMATMDLIKLAGGSPANFLDVGGGAKPETVRQAFDIILADPGVKAILINIFGGIVRCDRVATGVIEAARGLSMAVPIVIRLEGTNATEASTMLAQSGLPFKVAVGLKDAAAKVVEALGR